MANFSFSRTRHFRSAGWNVHDVNFITFSSRCSLYWLNTIRLLRLLHYHLYLLWKLAKNLDNVKYIMYKYPNVNYIGILVNKNFWNAASASSVQTISLIAANTVKCNARHNVWWIFVSNYSYRTQYKLSSIEMVWDFSGWACLATRL